MDTFSKIILLVQDIFFCLQYNKIRFAVQEMRNDMKKVTKEMTKQLASAMEYEEFYQSNKHNFNDMTLSEYLLALMEEKNLTTAQVVKNIGMGDYVYKLVSGRKDHPSRDILIRLAFGMDMNQEEIAKLMRITHFHELDPRDKRDAAILFALQKSFDLDRTNEMLYNLQLKTLDK